MRARGSASATQRGTGASGRPGILAAASGPVRSSLPPAASDKDEYRRQDEHATHGPQTDLDAYIARLLDDAPPLTSAQRDTLALILRPARAGGERI